MKVALLSGTLLVAVLALYATVYYSLVVSPEPHPKFQNGETLVNKKVEYRIAQEPVEIILAPMHHVDRRLRPEVWNREILPGKYYLTDDVQYFSPGPELKLANEAAERKAAAELKKSKPTSGVHELSDSQ